MEEITVSILFASEMNVSIFSKLVLIIKRVQTGSEHVFVVLLDSVPVRASHRSRLTNENRTFNNPVLLVPQGSVYRKVNAVEEIQQTKKDDFWVQTQVNIVMSSANRPGEPTVLQTPPPAFQRDEEIRRKEESRRAEQERQRMEREMREQEERQAKERERRANERNQQIERER